MSISSDGMPVLVILTYLFTVVCSLEVLENLANGNETTVQKLEFFVVTVKNHFFVKVCMDAGA